MKKNNCKWIAIVCGALTMTALAACNDYDEMTNESQADNVVNYVAPPTQSPVDVRTVTVKGSTYVFNGDYKGEGKALVDRVTAPAGSLQQEGVMNIIIHGNRIGSLSNQESTYLLLNMSRGAALVVAEPTAENMKTLTKKLHGVINSQSLRSNDEKSRSVVSHILGSRILQRIQLWSDSMIDTALGHQAYREQPLAVLAIRDEDSYVLTGEPQGETNTLSVMTRDENRNLKEAATLNYVDDSEMTDYHYGMRADNLARWLDTPDDDPVAQETSRRAAAKMMATRAGGRAEEYLDKITESVEYSLPVGFQVDGPQGHNPYHECTVKYRVWTAYSGEKKCDVYCITQEVTAFNQKLQCGPKKDTDWYNGSDWSPLTKLSKKEPFISKNIYGPYMKEFSVDCELEDGRFPVTLEEFAPQNSTSGGQNVTNGFSYSLGASVSAKSSGPEMGISSSMQWSHSVSRFDADLTMLAKATPEGKLSWKYTGKDPDSHYRPFSNYHETATTIQTNTCILQQGWVWTVKGSNSSCVSLKVNTDLTDNWLAYAIGTLECIPNYISQSHSFSTVIPIYCPPRHLQTWSMNVESDDVSADKLKEIESFLTAHLGQYFMPTCVFSTKKAEHKSATSLFDCDEVSAFVDKCKDAFVSSSGRELLREAGKRAGIPSTGSFTIVWRHTDLGVNSDREEFRFRMNCD